MSLLLALVGGSGPIDPPPVVEHGIYPYAYGGDWLLQPIRRKSLEAEIEQKRLALDIAPTASALIERVAYEVASEPQRKDGAERALRDAMRAHDMEYQIRYEAALAAYTAVWRAFNESVLAHEMRKREDEDTAVVLLLLH